jgi:hypothetical protein
MACLNNLGEAAYALRDNDEARRFFAEALTIAQETHTLPLVLKVLVNLAALFAREGETNYAARLFGLARQHPASEQATREKARRLQDEVASLPDLVAPDAAEQSLDSVVTEVLAQLTRGTIAPSL